MYVDGEEVGHAFLGSLESGRIYQTKNLLNLQGRISQSLTI